MSVSMTRATTRPRWTTPGSRVVVAKIHVKHGDMGIGRLFSRTEASWSM